MCSKRRSEDLQKLQPLRIKSSVGVNMDCCVVVHEDEHLLPKNKSKVYKLQTHGWITRMKYVGPIHEQCILAYCIPHCFAILATMVFAGLLEKFTCLSVEFLAMAMQSRNGNGWTWLSQSYAAYTIYIDIDIYIYTFFLYTYYVCIYIYPLANTVDARNLAIQLIKCGSFITFFYTKTAAGVADVEWAWGERWDLAEESHQVSWF